MFDSFVNFLLYLPRKFFEMILNMCAWLIENIPFSDKISSIFNELSTLWASLPSNLHYMFHLMAFSDGVKIVFLALTIRFLIKITPFIG